MPAPIIYGIGIIAGAVGVYGGLAGTNYFLSTSRAEAETAFNSRFNDITDPIIRKNYLDAFTHTYTSARVTQTSSSGFAHILGDLNELRGGNTAPLKNMDLWNNRLGRDLGTQITNQNDLLNAVENAIRNGQTINDPITDTRQYSDPYSNLTSDAIEELKSLTDLESIDGNDLNDTAPWNDDLNNPSNDSNGDGRADGTDGNPGDPNNPPQDPPPSPPSPPDLPEQPNREDDQGSPLVLDLDGDGIELYAVGDYGTYFDLQENGQAVLTGWVEPDDGLLAIDLNDDGLINDASELFGNKTTDGFTELKIHDANADGIIDSNDGIYSDLLVWVDTNSDGVSQSNELHTLSDLGISSISLDARRLAGEEIAGNTITHTATYTLSDGTEREIVDAWFTYDTLHSKNTDSYTLDVETLFLPTLRGFGDLKDLYIAMSVDNSTDPTSLKSLIKDLSDNFSLDDMFSDWSSVDTMVEDILIRWAGADDIDPTSRGDYVDAQHLAVNEAVRGYEFSQYGQPNPLPEAGQYSEAVFSYLKSYYSVQLITQIIGGEIFDDASYDLYSAGLVGDLNILQSGIDAIEALASDVNNDAVEVWTHFAQYIGYAKGLDNLTTSELTALDAAVVATGEVSLSDWQDVVSAMNVSLGSIIDSPDDWGSFEIYYDNNIVGTNSGETLTDTSAGGYTDNELKGKGGDDTLNGLDGHDKLWGGTGNDTLVGGTGDDYLLGEEGDDVYIYESGNDTVSEVGGNGYDEIRIASSTGLTQSNMTDMYRYGDELIIFFDTGESITIHGYNGQDTRIEKIVFETDSTEIDLSNLIEDKFYGTDGIDNLTVSGQQFQTLLTYGYDGNDVIQADNAAGKFYGGNGYDTLIGDFLNDELYGNAGDDYLIGLGGDDTLEGGAGNDSLDGGAGNDSLLGGDGDDIFYFGQGYGNDVIERTPHNNDRVVFNSDVLTNDVTLLRDDSSSYTRSDITFVITSTGDQLTVDDAYAKNSSWLYLIDNYSFADGTVWDAQFVREKYISDHTTTGNDTVIGFESDDIFYSSAGDDFIKGYSGDDIYYWGAGAGNDIIFDQTQNGRNDGPNGDSLIFEHLNLSDLNFVEVGGELVITNENTSETITVQRYFDSQFYQIDNFELADGTILDHTDIIGLTAGTYIEDPNSIDGTDSNDIIYGDVNGVANDVINGKNGTDNIYGYDGNDTLAGGNGNDTLRGGLGDDTFVWSYGDENDVIYDDGGTNQLVLHNVEASEITFLKVNNYDLKITIGSETIRIDNQLRSDYFNSSSHDKYQIQTAVLDDTTIIDLLNNLSFTGTENSESIYGLRYGDDTTYGLDGDDNLYGYDGNDTLIGGAGNDTLRGDDDNDTYIWSVGDGEDLIIENNGIDQIVLHNVTQEDIRFEKIGNYDLKIHIGDESITIDNQLRSDYSNSSAYDKYQVESVLLDDTTVIDLTDNITFTGTDSADTIEGLKNGDDTLVGLEGSDTLNGYKGNDVLYGGDGSDFLYAGDGDDILYGGDGIDLLYGQSGADTFVFESDSAFSFSDNIQDFDLSDGDKLDISDVLIGYDPLTDAITDFVQITETSGNSYLSVDADGGADNFVQIAYIYNETGLTDENALETSGNLITV